MKFRIPCQLHFTIVKIDRLRGKVTVRAQATTEDDARVLWEFTYTLRTDEGVTLKDFSMEQEAELGIVPND